MQLKRITVDNWIFLDETETGILSEAMTASVIVKFITTSITITNLNMKSSDFHVVQIWIKIRQVSMIFTDFDKMTLMGDAAMIVLTMNQIAVIRI